MTAPHKHITFVAVVLMSAGFVACTETPVQNNANPFLPTISNTWADVTDGAHRFRLSSNDDGEPHGTFDGFELVPNDSFPLSGSFVNENIEFTITRSSAVQFSGMFVHADTMQLNSPTDGALTIWR